jgi:hypothetical protein
MARHQQKQRTKGKASAARASEHLLEEAKENVGAIGERMGATAQKVGGRLAGDAQEGARQFAVIGERAFEAWMRSSNEALRRALELNVELATWSREQLSDSMTAARSLAQCRTVGDAYGVQIGLMRSSMEKSMRHASNVLNLAAHAMVDSTRMAQPAVSGSARLAQAD